MKLQLLVYPVAQCQYGITSVAFSALLLSSRGIIHTYIHRYVYINIECALVQRSCYTVAVITVKTVRGGIALRYPRDMFPLGQFSGSFNNIHSAIFWYRDHEKRPFVTRIFVHIYKLSKMSHSASDRDHFTVLNRRYRFA